MIVLSPDVITVGKQERHRLDMKTRKCVDARSDALTAVLLKIISWKGTGVLISP